MTGASQPRTRVAILGGGVGAMSAAYALTDREDLRERYEVTVYQMGWRLGGKGASGRNADCGQRIEEHGLHIWMGCYENAFRVMQRCYDELGRPPGHPLRRWDDAFKKHNLITLMEEVDGDWRPWASKFEPNDEVPGQGQPSSHQPWDFVKRLLGFLHNLHERSPHAPRVHAPWGGTLGHLAGVVEKAFKDVFVDDGGLPAEPLTHLHHAHRLAHELPDDPAEHEPQHHHAILGLVERFAEDLCHAVRDRVAHNDDLRHLLLAVDLGTATLRGLFRDDVLRKGLDPLDEWEFRDWLRHHGAGETALKSAPIKAVYDLVFAYEKGDPGKPNIAAGVALRTLLRTGWAYKGAFAWEMQAGMGDVVFAPLYEVLRRRGVRFRFFHRVENLGLSADGEAVETIDVGVQATVTGDEYRPLVDVKGLPCWPDRPLYEQLVQGDELRQRGIDLESAWSPWEAVGRRALRRGEDFDQVVLGISVAALPYLTRELSAANPAWAAMLAHVKTVQTQAFQLWLGRDAEELGWDADEPAVVGSYPACWADMSHLIPREDWDAGPTVKNVSYFCYPLGEPEPVPAPGTDPNFPLKEARRVKGYSLDFLRRDVGALWPAATTPPETGPLDWSSLVDAGGGAGEARFDAQFWRANIDPSERYVLSVAGSTKYRLGADESGFANLYLAGDWTRNGLNAGCVEAAVISGLQAARALCGHPEKIPGEFDVEPRPGARRDGGPSMTSSDRPLFVPRGGEQVFCQPLELRQVRFTSFLFPADGAALQGMCDRYLNVPSRGKVHYRPLLPRVLLGVADVGRVFPVHSPDEGKGYVSEIDIAFWVPVAASKEGPGVSLTERVAWFLPYVFVNDAWACAAGREVYGFPKEMGVFQVPRGAADPALIAVDTLAIERFGPQAQARVQRLLEVKRADATHVGDPHQTWHQAEEVLMDFGRVLHGDGGLSLPGLGLLEEFVQLLTCREVPMVFLRQFRDVADGRRACYQAVVEALTRVLHFRQAGRLAGDYRLTLSALDSHPIARELGLSGQGQEALGAWYVDFDFVLENGRELWRA